MERRRRPSWAGSRRFIQAGVFPRRRICSGRGGKLGGAWVRPGAGGAQKKFCHPKGGGGPSPAPAAAAGVGGGRRGARPPPFLGPGGGGGPPPATVLAAISLMAA